MITNYLNDLDYRNTFLTTEFWYIDAKCRLKKCDNFGGPAYFDKDRMEQYGVQTLYEYTFINIYKNAKKKL